MYGGLNSINGSRESKIVLILEPLVGGNISNETRVLSDVAICSVTFKTNQFKLRNSDCWSGIEQHPRACKPFFCNNRKTDLQKYGLH